MKDLSLKNYQKSAFRTSSKEYYFWIVIFSIIVISCLLAPVLPIQDPKAVDLSCALRPPSSAHPFGTDSIGRDILSRLLYGGMVSLGVALSTTAVGILIGVVYGGIAGYVGGKTDQIMMRLTETIFSIPSTILILAFQMSMDNKILGMLIIMSLTNWMTMARVIRAQVMELKQKDFIKIAINTNVPTRKILFSHMARNCASSIIICATFVFAGAIMTETSLSFLGIGIPQEIPSWGSMLYKAQNHILTGAWWAAFFPGIFIILSTLCINFIGEHLKKIQ